MAVLCWALLASLGAGFYYYQYKDLRSRIAGKLEYVDVGVDYGNSTQTWYNNTETLSGMTLFDVTKHITNMTYTIGALGTKITAINNVSGQGNYGWTYWIWNSTSNTWSIVFEGADEYIIVGGEIFMWYYTNNFNPPP
jgi:hypothetical protein